MVRIIHIISFALTLCANNIDILKGRYNVPTFFVPFFGVDYLTSESIMPVIRVMESASLSFDMASIYLSLSRITS